MSLLANAEGGEATGSIWGFVFYLVLILGIIFGLFAYAKKGLGQKVFKNPITACTEQLYLFIESMCVGTVGAHGRKYVPMIFTFWVVIFISNLVGLFFPETLTAILSFNLGMALISIGYVQYEGIRTNGLFGHFAHFAGPKLGWKFAALTVVIFSIEIVSELMKNVSLTLRLFGNIHGGHQAVEAMNSLLAKAYIPVGEFLLPIKLLTVIVQALIFCLLTCVYLSLVTHHDHDEEHAESGHGELAPAA